MIIGFNRYRKLDPIHITLKHSDNLWVGKPLFVVKTDNGDDIARVHQPLDRIQLVDIQVSSHHSCEIRNRKQAENEFDYQSLCTHFLTTCILLNTTPLPQWACSDSFEIVDTSKLGSS